MIKPGQETDVYSSLTKPVGFHLEWRYDKEEDKTKVRLSLCWRGRKCPYSHNEKWSKRSPNE